jgi:vacuolar iron transporter family protein
MRTFGQHNGRHGLEAAMRQLVFGLEDGIVSTTGAVVGIAAGSQNAQVVILSGTVLILVEALSMAAGEYLSSKSQREFLEQKIREEEHEIETMPEKEKLELAVMYRERGFSEDEIAIIVKRITADKKLWLEEMISKELGIGAGELAEAPSGAAVMWLSYTIGGAVPLLPFLLLPLTQATVVGFVIALVALFALGFWKAKVAGIDAVRSGFEMVSIAAGAGILGYLAGIVVGGYFDLPTQLG